MALYFNLQEYNSALIASEEDAVIKDISTLREDVFREIVKYV